MLYAAGGRLPAGAAVGYTFSPAADPLPSGARAMSRIVSRLVALVAVLLPVAAPVAAGAADPFVLNPGDHICIVGNTLAERMQHDGHLEALLHARFPTHNLVIRNLGFSADEITTALRSENFGTQDQWLSADAPVPRPQDISQPGVAAANRFEKAGTKPDVIFAFYGYNESFAGAAGLPKFERDLAAYLDHLAGRKYNGKSAPRVVLFSPIAYHRYDANLPDGGEINKRLALYADAMGKVAAAKGARFVDLFRASDKVYTQFNILDLSSPGSRPTINGIHLTAGGNRSFAGAIGGEPWIGGPIDGALFAAAPPSPHADKIRAAVVAKNHVWFNRYRAVDGYSTFGSRAFLKFTGGQTNYEVVQRELEVLDVMTANRDKVIWAAAQGQSVEPDDSNLPTFVPVSTNKPGSGPNGTHLFLSGEEAISKMTVGKGLKVNLFADEAMFPELANPMQMQFDAAGRLWVAVWPTYPHWKPGEPMNDKLLVLEDTDGDGKADKCTTFADGLHNPTGFEFGDGGVFVAQCPDIVFLQDTDGDGKADVRERVLHGMDTADTHHASNSFARGPAGELYFQEGTFHNTQVETPYGPPRRVQNGAVFRYEPRTKKFDIYVTYGFANPHGHAFNALGQDIVVDGTGANPYDAALFSGYLPFPEKHGRPPQVYQQRTRPCGGITFLSSSHFPDDFRDNLIVTNCIGFQGLLRYKIEPTGATLKGTELEPILSSTDEKFRPVDVKTGPDGAIYFVDWQNPIIGHMQHNLRDPSRDRTHGRVYRVVHEDRALTQSPKIAGEPVPALVQLLTHPDNDVRARARLELHARRAADVLAAAEAFVATAPPAAADRANVEALWLHQAFHTVHVAALDRVLNTNSPFRPAAVRVLAQWKDQVPDALDRLRKLAADPAPRVRLEAVRAASFFAEPEAIEVVLIAGEQPADKAVEYLAAETLRALNPAVRAAAAAGREVKFATPAGARFFLKNVGTDDLVKMKRSPAVFTELVGRPGVRDEVRREAVAGLAAGTGKPAWQVVVAALNDQDRPKASAADGVAYDLVRLLLGTPAELPAARPALEALATGAESGTLRQLAFAALVAADGSADKAWALASKSVLGVRDFVAAVPQIRDPNQRAAVYPRMAELVTAGLPAELAKTVPATAGVRGRVVRVTLPGKLRTLTLAEVEVLSDGKNVARTGKARQISTGHGGTADKAIDGNVSGRYADGGQSHTQEGETDPWWEVDLGSDTPIDAVTVYNRTDSNLNARLSNFALTVTDAAGREVFRKANNPSPDGSLTVAVGGESPARAVRASAMLALTTVRGKEADAVRLLAPFVASPDRPAAVAAIQRVPVAAWPKELAPGLLKQVTAAAAAIPPADRTSPAAADLLQFADALAGLLPRDDAKAARKSLGELGVRVVRVGTLTDQMLFDQDRLVVRAGKPVEFVFANTDLMPHNFVVTKMGALEEVGNRAEAFGSTPGAQDKHYVPPSDKVLLASRLLQPGTSQTLRFTAPTTPGVYPYVCTYPGHWRRMYGALYVVADLDDYLADPAGYVAAHPVPVADAMLKLNRPRTEWTLTELAPAVAGVKHGGRSHAHGKQLFAVATCVGCHQFDGQGVNFGPNLAALDKAVFKTPADVLEHILNPSLRVVDQYKSYTFNLASGATVTGMVLEKTAAGDYKVIENPLAKAEARLVKKDDLDDQPKASPVSIMPKGLLDKLTKDEILDLVAYVWAGADPMHPAFQGGHDHGTHGHAGHDHHSMHTTTPAPADAKPWLEFPAGGGPGEGKHVVLVSGDEEYRSEEALPQLAKILSTRHGFRCTVLFATDPATGTVNPNVATNIPGLAALDAADLVVLATRMRNLPDAQMGHFARYIAAGKPVVGLRTATHAFATTSDKYKKWGWANNEKGFEGGFGKHVLGQTWVAHHGDHGKEGTRGVPAPGRAAHPVLRGISPESVFGPTDVYRVTLPLDPASTPVLLGQVTATLDPHSPAVTGPKNTPMMPVAWTRNYTFDGGEPGRAFTTTLGASQDLAHAGTRRLVVNGCYWVLGLDVPAETNVDLVGDYKPTAFRFRPNADWQPGKVAAEYGK